MGRRVGVQPGAADHVAVLYLGHVASVVPAANLDTQQAVELITTGTLADVTAGTAGGNGAHGDH